MSRLEGTRILVVEDFDSLRSLVVRVLTSEGYEVVGVGTGSSAVALFSSEHFDLMITDHALPDADGAEIARGAFTENPRLKVLFMSGTPESSLDLEVSGARTAFLQKPFDIDALTARVRELLTAPAE